MPIKMRTALPWESKKDEDSLKKRNLELKILNRIISIGNKTIHLNELLPEFFAATLALLDFDGGGIYLVNSEKRIAEVVYHQGLPDEFIQPVKRVNIDEEPFKTVLINGEPFITEDYPSIFPETHYGILSVASIPLIAKEKVIGALNIASKHRYHFSDEEIQILKVIGRETGNTVSRVLLEEKLILANEKLRREINERKLAEERAYQRTFELQEIFKLTHSIGSVLDYNELMSLLLKQIYNAVPYDVSASILVVNSLKSIQYLTKRPFTAPVQAEIQKRMINTLNQPTELSPKFNEKEFNIQIIDSEDFDPLNSPINHLNSLIQVPLILDPSNEIVGLLFVGAEKQGVFTDDHTRFLYTIANQASLSIQRLQALINVEKQRRSSLLEHLPIGVLLLDNEKRVQLTNPAARLCLPLLTNKKENKFILELGGQPLENFFHPKKQGMSHETLVTTSSTQVFEIVTRPMQIATQTEGWVVVLREVTKEIKLQKLLTQQAVEVLAEKDKIETILEIIPEGILVLDADGRITLANKAFKTVSHPYIGEEIQYNVSCLDLSTNIFANAIKKLFLAKTGGSVTIEPKTDEYLQLTSTVLNSLEKPNFGLVIAVRDISSFLKLVNMRKQFVSTVSHELRTPISVIAHSIANLERFKEKMTEIQQNKLMDAISRNIKLLADLIEDFLLLSMVQEERLHLKWESYNPLAILRDILYQMDPHRKAKKIAIELFIIDELQLRGDSQKIGQIFRILIDNALKYSSPNSFFQISAKDKYQGVYNPKMQDGVLFEFSDTGRGIQEKDLPYLFDRFFRSEEVENISGSGLGLSIARELVLLHQGRIYVESEYGKGSTFSVFLPRLNEIPSEIAEEKI